MSRWARTEEELRGRALADRDRSFLRKALKAAGVAEGQRRPAAGPPDARAGQAESGSRGKRKEPEVPRMCEYHARGNCVRGLTCKLAHSEDELKALKARLEGDSGQGTPRPEPPVARQPIPGPERRWMTRWATGRP